MSNVRSHHILGREKIITRLRDAIVGPEGEFGEREGIPGTS